MVDLPAISQSVYQLAKRARRETKDPDPLAAIVEAVWAEAWRQFAISASPEYCIREGCGHQVLPLTLSHGFGRASNGGALCHPVIDDGTGHPDCYTMVTRDYHPATT